MTAIEHIRTRIIGDLGEYLVAWYLQSELNVEVSMSKSEGIDILARGNAAHFFNDGTNVAVSVKTRQRHRENYDDSVRIEWEKLEEKANRWSAIPFIAYVRLAPKLGLVTCYLTSAEQAKRYCKSNSFNVRLAQLDQRNILFSLTFTDPAALLQPGVVPGTAKIATDVIRARA